MKTQANGAQAQQPECSEAMSRLLDGELEAGACRELFERLGHDGEAQRTWVLLNVASDALRSSETAALHSSGFVTRVSSALAAEPVILAPGALRRRRTVLRRVSLQAAAIAAAAVALAVVVLPQLRGGPEPVVQAKAPELLRSAEFEAYLEAHRENAAGTVTSPSDYVLPAALPAALPMESR
ncbi:MAG TPA: sigma-E factor negative regulatory protein [Burkholderiaceae bacterium]|nr:sigma-E factor negative regulatory protein [Burkholderiaceae bacterium]